MATIAIDVFATNNNFKAPICRTPLIEVFPSHLRNASSHTGSFSLSLSSLGID